MLLYIFWHWPQLEMDLAAYERDEAQFQRALLEAAPSGLLGSGVFRCEDAAWANAGGSAYEDCYVLQDSAALDVLNEAAVRGPCKEPHDRLAAAMQGGAGGLYSLVVGRPMQVPKGRADWFAKPPGVRYADLYSRLEPALALTGASLWRRQMVLSPAPEFCAFGLDTSIASGVGTLFVPRDPVWISGGV